MLQQPHVLADGSPLTAPALVAQIRAADVVVAVSGTDGALASVVAGLVSAPVIAVPTSVGYGASLGGISSLLGSLTASSPGGARPWQLVQLVLCQPGHRLAGRSSELKHLGCACSGPSRLPAGHGGPVTSGLEHEPA